MVIVDLPSYVDGSEPFLVELWASKLGVTSRALLQAIQAAGPQASKFKKYLKRGYRISWCEDGKEFLVAQINPQADGFSVQVPFFSKQNGMIIKIPQNYSKKVDDVPLSTCEVFRVSSPAKLSFHMGGFVQFSSATNEKIVSGFDWDAGRPKGIGLKAPHEVTVETGPLFSIQIARPSDFKENVGLPTIAFGESDLWRNVLFDQTRHDSYNFEFFMFGVKELQNFSIDNKNRRIFKRRLPFAGRFQFLHELRVIELPGKDFFLGVIVSRNSTNWTWNEGYVIGGPGCRDEEGNFFGIHAQYPSPQKLSEAEIASLDYKRQNL